MSTMFISQGFCQSPKVRNDASDGGICKHQSGETQTLMNDFTAYLFITHDSDSLCLLIGVFNLWTFSKCVSKVGFKIYPLTIF